MKKFFLVLCAAVGISLLPVAAHASGTGYVCRVQEYNYFGFGNNGGLLITFYSGKACTGSLQITVYACTTSSTDPVCSSSAYYNYSEAQLMTIMNNLLESGRTGNQITYTTTATCRSGGTNCLQGLDFYTN